MQSLSHGQNQRGGLCHLVEAATALTSLVSPSSSHSYPPHSLIRRVSASTPSVVSVSDDDESSTATTPQNTPKSKRREIFPQRLFAILSDSSLSDVVSWLPHGRSFVIIRPDVFAAQVLPKYLPSEKSTTKYPSFTRKLNRWGFRQATRGADTGAFHHPLFLRDQPELCLGMVCQKSRKTSTSTSSKRPSKIKKEVKTTATPSTPSSSKRPSSSQSSSSQGSSLPPKKRKLQAFSPEPRSEMKKPTVVTPPPREEKPARIPTTTAAAPAFPVVLPSASVGSATSPAVVPCLVPSDPTFVASTLKARDEMEKLTVAKSMLYNAYLKALDGH